MDWNNFRFLRFVHNFYNKNEKLGCLYNALTLDTIYYDGSMFDIVNQGLKNGLQVVIQHLADSPKLEKLLRALLSKKMIVKFKYDELKLMNSIVRKVLKGPRIRNLIMLMTDNCNMSCKYCYIEKSLPTGYKHSFMTIKTAKAAIDKFISIANPDAKAWTIEFYGGEPLLNWEAVKFSLQYLYDLKKSGKINKKINKILITNGTLINEKNAVELKKNNVHVAISIDGPAEVHNMNRVYSDGKGTFDDVYRGFEFLKKSGITPSISAVMTKQSMLTAIDNVRYFIEKLGVKQIGFNHVSIIPNVNSYDPDYEKNFGEILLKIQELILNTDNAYERRMSNKLYNFLMGNIQKADCTGCGEQISVSPDGTIGVCQGFVGSRFTFNKSVFDPDYNPNNDPVFNEWSLRSPLNMKQCYDCPALGICGGGCPRNAYMLHGSIWEKDTAYCHFAKQAVEWLIWKKTKLMKDKIEVLKV